MHEAAQVPRMGAIWIERESAVDRRCACVMLARQMDDGRARHPEGIGIVLTGLDRLSS